MSYDDCMSMFRLVFWGVVVHVILLVSVFDIHFKSPVLRNVVPLSNDIPAPAKRLVLFIGDGVRADSFYKLKNGTSSAPFLRSIYETSGMWGISNAHVPTESRPGHVAIIAGMYEDPSAIFKGWQDYVVDFDSVLNRSYASFSWGSPDIVNIFSRGSKKVNSFNNVYSSLDQQFSGINNTAMSLTYWVADQFELFMSTLNNDSNMASLVNNEKNVFFFHFLGPDVAGHTYNPQSEEYIENIMAVDKCVQRIHKLMHSYFKDNKTAFIFTSDHGMTDWGSHGDGTPDETLTPLVTWGAGLSPPKIKLISDFHYSWTPSKFRGIEINQADLAPLMSALIGISIPVNSIGTLPTEFLHDNPEWVLQSVILNVNQLKSQFKIGRHIIENKLFSVFFKSYPEPAFEKFLKNDSSPVDSSMSYNVSMKILFALDACSVYISGIDYYRNYYSSFLLILLSFLFVGWMLTLCFEILSRSKFSGVIFCDRFSSWCPNWDDTIQSVGVATTMILLFLLIGQGMQVNFYVYSFLTLGLWWNILPRIKQFYNALPFLDIACVKLIAVSILFLIGLELLVLSFKSRGVLCIVVLALPLLWYIEEMKKFQFHRNFICWLVSSVLVAFFPLLPTVGAYRSITVVVLSGIFWFISRLSFSYFHPETNIVELSIQLFTILLATWNAWSVDRSFTMKEGLFLSNQIVSWSILLTSIFMLKLGPLYLHQKFIFISHSFCLPFILLSSGHEALFVCLLTAHLFFWMTLEFYGFRKINEESYEFIMWGPRNLKYCNFRIAFFFLTYTLLAFFGLGNIASLNSFDPSWVRSFITLFSPFTMMILIIFKTIIPIFIVTCCLRVIIPVCQESTEIIFSIVLLYCDVIGLHFFLSVTNQGSWLQIGTSLSQFIIMETLTILLLIFYAVALFIMPRKTERLTYFLESTESDVLLQVK